MNFCKISKNDHFFAFLIRKQHEKKMFKKKHAPSRAKNAKNFKKKNKKKILNFFLRKSIKSSKNYQFLPQKSPIFVIFAIF